MESEVFLSVIVPVYNAGEYLKECLDSLAAQTLREMEVILVDDGSTDGSGEVCDTCAAEHAQFLVIHKENGGPASAKREGLRIARGAYIGFADSDDWVEADYYQKLTEHAKQSGAEIVTCGLENDVEGILTDRVPAGIYRGERLQKLRRHVLYSKQYEAEAVRPSAYTKIYRKERILPYLTSLPDGLYVWEDLCYVYPPFFDATCVEITKECGYHYRVHDASVTHSADNRQWEKTVYTVSVARDVYARFTPEIQSAFYARCACIFNHYLWKACASAEDGRKSVSSAAAFLKRATQPEVFGQITSAALRDNSIKNKTVKTFLTMTANREYTKAVCYCRARVFASKCIRLLKGKRNR